MALFTPVITKKLVQNRSHPFAGIPPKTVADFQIVYNRTTDKFNVRRIDRTSCWLFWYTVEKYDYPTYFDNIADTVTFAKHCMQNNPNEKENATIFELQGQGELL